MSGFDSFFGNDTKSRSSGPIVSKVRKQIPKPPTSTTHTHSSTPKSGHPSHSISRTSSSKPYASTHLQVGNKSSKGLLNARTPPLPPHIDTTPSKRKSSTPLRIQSASPTPSDESASSSSSRTLDVPQAAKRPKLGRKGTSIVSGPDEENDDLVREGIWGFGEVDERGEWGRGWSGFVGGEEVLRGISKGWAGGGDIKKGELDKYVAYFPEPGFEKAEPLPSVELLYPATGCREKFVLLAAQSNREYAPIIELRNALRLILAYYIPPSHQQIFGTLSSSLDLDNMNPLPSRLSSPTPESISTPPVEQPSETIGDALRKALAPNRRDGPGLLKAMERYNTAMEEIQLDGSLARWMQSRPKLSWREWTGLCEVIGDHAYGRIVGPFAEQLAHHPKHPEEVAKAISAKEDAYGELRHVFMSRIIEQTRLGPESVFVDLGSGVGNCVLQAALQAGSRSYGFELLPVPARCARLQLREAQRRWAMWGIKGNLDVEVHEGDFRTHPQVAKRLREADVVLVNNEVFPPSLNADLTNMFLDLKDGAKIISLRPFVPPDFRMNESNCDSFAAIVKVSQHTYHKDWVTWKGDSGIYYVQVIDRSMRKKFEETMNGGRRRR